MRELICCSGCPQLNREACVRVVAAEGLTPAPSYRPGCGCATMPGNRVLFPVANIHYTGTLPVTRTRL